MSTKRHVYLWSIPSPAIIVPGSTDVIYVNQVNGVATVHREIEGWLLPLPKLRDRVFDPEWWERHFNRRVAGDDDAWCDVVVRIEAALNAMISSGEAPTSFRVIAHQHNSEAWVHVRFAMPRLGPDAKELSYEELEGVLTWENCD